MMDSSGFTCTFIIFIVLSSTHISSTETQTHIWAFRGNLEIYILIGFVRLRDSNVGCFESVKRYNDTFCLIKGTVHPKIKQFCHHLLSLKYFQPVWMCLFCRTQRRYSEEWGNRAVLGNSMFFPTMEVNGVPKQPDYKLSQNLPLCSAEQTHSCRFGNTWGWVNDVHFWVYCPFKRFKHHQLRSIMRINCRLVSLIMRFKYWFFGSC